MLITNRTKLLLYFLLLANCCFIGMANHNSDISLNLNSQDNIQEAPIRIFIGILPSLEHDLIDVRLVKSCLERTGQLIAEIQSIKKPKSKKDVKSLFEKGFDWVIFINKSSSLNIVELRIYDPIEACMISGKKISLNYSKQFLSYKFADYIWQEVMDEPSSFTSKIAFIKRKKGLTNKNCSELWISDFDGSNMCKFKDDSNIYVGLRWYKSSNRFCLLGSEITKFNVKLVSFGLNKIKKVLLDMSGTSVGVSLCSSNKKAVYCRSGDIWSYRKDFVSNKYLHKRLIHNDGKNTTPSLLKNGDIIFCSNSKELFSKSRKKGSNCISGPKIYYFNNDSGKVDLITPEGYCESPAYSEVNNKIAYSKSVNGDMQLFIYDINDKRHQQITFSLGSKVDCDWSPCGKYLVFCHKTKLESRIKIIHIELKKEWCLTSGAQEYVYPTWSSNFCHEFNIIEDKI